MRLIDADRLIETIRQHHYMLADRFNSQDWGMFTIGIEEAIDMQPTVNEWIPVERELPETRELVLVTYLLNIDEGTEECFDVDFYNSDVNEWFFHTIEEVIAWRPIPKYTK